METFIFCVVANFPEESSVANYQPLNSTLVKPASQKFPMLETST